MNLSYRVIVDSFIQDIDHSVNLYRLILQIHFWFYFSRVFLEESLVRGGDDFNTGLLIVFHTGIVDCFYTGLLILYRLILQIDFWFYFSRGFWKSVVWGVPSFCTRPPYTRSNPRTMPSSKPPMKKPCATLNHYIQSKREMSHIMRNELS